MGEQAQPPPAPQILPFKSWVDSFPFSLKMKILLIFWSLKQGTDYLQLPAIMAIYLCLIL